MTDTYSSAAGDIALLDETQAAFIVGSVSINVGTCSAELVPSVVRGHGCRVSADRRRVTVFVSIQRAAALLADLHAGGAIAVVFSLPRSHETLQLKGVTASIVPLEDDDQKLMQAYAESFVDEVCRLGYKESFARAVMSSVDEESVGLIFEPTAAFVQTPGPKAGQRLEPRP